MRDYISRLACCPRNTAPDKGEEDGWMDKNNIVKSTRTMIPQKLKTLDQQPRDPDTVTSWESLNVFIHIALTIRMFFLAGESLNV